MSDPAPGPDGRGGPHVFVDDLDDPVLDPDDRHHLVRVLRLRPGQPLTISDGAGRWRACELGDEPEPTGAVEVVPAGRPITIGFPPVKGERPDWAVQKLTEIGVDRIVLLETERGVVRWSGDRATKHLDRLRRIAREAAMQSRRVRLPELEGPVPLRNVVGEPGVALADRSGEAPDASTSTVLIGPEGGWSDAERALGVRRICVGRNVLRVETAALAAAVSLTTLG
ncbi:MAG: RsmE family RNA methyltransferase [Actinomycetota bacterium]